jgi:hypothetical protein
MTEYHLTDDDIYVRLENEDPAESFSYGYFVNPTKICSKPNKYITEFVNKSVPAEFTEVAAAVGNIFDDPGRQELRYICDKAVAEAKAAKEELKRREAEFEAKENAIYADLENAILKTKVEIYERLIFERGI